MKYNDLFDKYFTNKQNEINTLSILFILLFKYLKRKLFI